MGGPRRIWTAEDDALLIAMREVDGLRWADIDAHFKRASGACYTRYEHIRPAALRPTRLPKASRAEALAERDQHRALVHASITAAVFGDPLPGRSALDERMAIAQVSTAPAGSRSTMEA